MPDLLPKLALDEPSTTGAVSSAHSGLRIVAPVMAFGMLLGTGSAQQTVASVEALLAVQHKLLDVGTSSGTTVEAREDQPSEPSLATTVRMLQRRSGLTWGELADALAVSVRAVHHWSTGKRLSARHARRFQELVELVDAHKRSTPDETRDRLMAPGTDRRSPLAAFRDESHAERFKPNPLSPTPLASFLEQNDSPAPQLIQAATESTGAASRQLSDHRHLERGSGQPH